MKDRIGAAIRAKREVFGYTQEELAEEVGVSSSFIGQVERGDASPSIETLASLTRILAIDANEYFYDSAEINRRTKEIREFHLMLEQLTPEMRKLSLDIIKLIYKSGR